ncbi:DUF3489 domain-containing protein [Phaeovulum sp. NW3]|uniref:DUF3489 domain-containing protein n=1 Tax=Phaeovulum sp. NW3 TaxID=2934933 RepID=UPI0020226A08|nr:DUF3489 domain-containing protein [Phaeovulum sp. NW3]MCL7466322.1 DUF3489 domain-containing protein [Phaeovulum sp. NW3]
MTTPSDTQSLILSRAATRPGNLALPLPEGLAGAAAKMVVGKMIARDWLEEVEANLRRGEPMWREIGEGHGTTLIATEAGLEAIGIEPVVVSVFSSVRKARAVPPSAPDAPARIPGRAGTKQAQIIAMLSRAEGATVTEMVRATGWQAHTVRGAISGGLKKKLGLPITTEKVEGRGTVYRHR